MLYVPFTLLKIFFFFFILFCFVELHLWYSALAFVLFVLPFIYMCISLAVRMENLTNFRTIDVNDSLVSFTWSFAQGAFWITLVLFTPFLFLFLFFFVVSLVFWLLLHRMCPCILSYFSIYLSLSITKHFFYKRIIISIWYSLDFG